MESELHARDTAGVQDFVLLEDFKSEDAFLENLEKRYKSELIYVSIQMQNLFNFFLKKQSENAVKFLGLINEFQSKCLQSIIIFVVFVLFVIFCKQTNIKTLLSDISKLK